MEKKIIFLFAFVPLLTWVAILSGQGMNARITGNISDEEGNYLTGVLVSAINTHSNAEITNISEAKNGAFRFLALAPGFYQLSFELKGYVTYVASGIRLNADQSVFLRIKLKRDRFSQEANGAPAGNESRPLGEAGPTGPKLAAPGRGVSLALNVGFNYLVVGDSNRYLSRLSGHVGGPVFDSVDTLHSGFDFNAELGYRISPRLEIAIGLGVIRDRKPDNYMKGKSRYAGYPYNIYTLDTTVKAFPLQLICRYWLGRAGVFSGGVHAAILFNRAYWRNQTDFSYFLADGAIFYTSHESENASAWGAGFAAGARGELVMGENVAFIIDLTGRYAPVWNFSGRRTFSDQGQWQSFYPGTRRGRLWSFEHYDAGLDRWVWDLGIGGRPAGPGTRNVGSARVDFSGFAVKIGLVFRFGKEHD